MDKKIPKIDPKNYLKDGIVLVLIKLMRNILICVGSNCVLLYFI